MHWSCFSKGWNSLAANNVKRVTKGGQRCHESMYQVWLWYVKELLRNGLTSCLAALPSSLIGCHGQMVLNLNICSAWWWNWRSYMASFMKIGQNLWPVDMYYWFWQLSTWRPKFLWEIIYQQYGEVWQHHQTLKISLKYTHVKREELKHIFINNSAP